MVCAQAHTPGPPVFPYGEETWRIEAENRRRPKVHVLSQNSDILCSTVRKQEDNMEKAIVCEIVVVSRPETNGRVDQIIHEVEVEGWETNVLHDKSSTCNTERESDCDDECFNTICTFKFSVLKLI